MARGTKGEFLSPVCVCNYLSAFFVGILAHLLMKM